MSRRRGRPPAVDSIETRRRILDAARRSFASRGYDATTNKEVAAEAGVTTGALYHYVRSKAELYVEVYAEVQDAVFGAFEATLAHESLADRLAAVLDAAVVLNRADPSMAGFVVGVTTEAQRHDELRELLAPLQARSYGFSDRLVRDAVARGELASEVDADGVADMVNILLSGLARFATLTGDADRHARAADALRHLVAGTLLTAGARAPTGAP